jgi:hypothetical protein
MDTMELQILTKVVYYAKISKMGDKKMVIIPKVYWDDIKDLEDEKQIKITLEDIEHNKKK